MYASQNIGLCNRTPVLPGSHIPNEAFDMPIEPFFYMLRFAIKEKLDDLGTLSGCPNSGSWHHAISAVLKLIPL